MSGPSVEVPGKSEAEIFGLAASIRRNLRIDTDGFPVIEFLELGMPQLFPGFSFALGSKEEMGSNHGLTIPSENTILLREDVYEGLYGGVGRDRFTAAHEIGHYIMHRNVPIRFHRSAARLKPYMDSEWQANRFAGALLMPEEKLKKCSSLTEVTQRFGVSRDAAAVQNRVLAKKQKMGILF
ncbi:ImmA/IrrE family metallo-endopeptidase [Stutzerimonas nitrititolerans]|uniref:ImmA/IrrE family metallo-endopeptidase n=1 Tax=Stutzerimonas nitrititolerans TaxID=2482751 RepID=UPI0028A73FBD|nr:ImmA/IrrE family metallo-endopeptidase [Stutzerimonas nitrititolerans]